MGQEPQFSPDRRWWWTGSEWIPADHAFSGNPAPAPISPRRKWLRRWPWFLALGCTLLVGFCSVAVANSPGFKQGYEEGSNAAASKTPSPTSTSTPSSTDAPPDSSQAPASD